MTSAEILQLISVLSFVLAGVAFVLAIFLLIHFQIPKVIGDLSGKTAKKSIAKMRSRNQSAGGQGYRPSAINQERGKLTNTMPQTEQPPSPAKAQKKTAEPEKKQQEPRRKQEPPKQQVPADRPQQPAAMPPRTAAETTLLTEKEEETTLLQGWQAAPEKQETGERLEMLDKVMLIHTDEVIG